MKSIINKSNGNLSFEDGFIISKDTTADDLTTHFGKHLRSQKQYKDYYFLPQRKIGDYYVIFTFEFKNKLLKKIGFEIESEPIKREPWSNNRDLETKWIADQMNDKSNFKWNMRIAGRHYHLPYNWGCIGVYYDFKNGTFDSGLFYNIEDQ